MRRTEKEETEKKDVEAEAAAESRGQEKVTNSEPNAGNRIEKRPSLCEGEMGAKSSEKHGNCDDGPTNGADENMDDFASGGLEHCEAAAREHTSRDAESIEMNTKADQENTTGCAKTNGIGSDSAAGDPNGCVAM